MQRGRIESGVVQAMKVLFDSKCDVTQVHGIAFSIYLSYLLSPNLKQAYMMAAPHSAKSRELLRQKGVLRQKRDEFFLRDTEGVKPEFQLYPEEYLLDIFVDTWAVNKANKPPLVCESEMAKQHAIGYLKDEEDSHQNGYIRDFVKLFFVASQRRVFTCRTPKKHHKTLAHYMNWWAGFYSKFWITNNKPDDLIVTILPTSPKDDITLGLGKAKGAKGWLEFKTVSLK